MTHDICSEIYIYIYWLIARYTFTISPLPPPPTLNSGVAAQLAGRGVLPTLPSSRRSRRCLLCDRADMSAVLHSRHFLRVTQETCPLCHTADTSAGQEILFLCVSGSSFICKSFSGVEVSRKQTRPIENNGGPATQPFIHTGASVKGPYCM